MHRASGSGCGTSWGRSGPVCGSQHEDPGRLAVLPDLLRPAAWPHGTNIVATVCSYHRLDSVVVAGYVLGSSGQAPHVVVYLLPAHREAFRPWSGIPRRKVSVEIEGVFPVHLSNPLPRTSRVRESRSLRFGGRISGRPSRCRLDDRLAVPNAHLRTGPQGKPMRSCRIGRTVAWDRLDLAEGRPPLRLGANGEKMTVERRIPVSGRYVDYKPVSYGGHEPYLGKSSIAPASMSTPSVDRQRTLDSPTARQTH